MSIAHHVYGDGEQFDELVSDRTDVRRSDPKEFRADVFAGQLLMPKSTVLRSFSLRHFDPRTCAPGDVYTVASWLGVGYTTLVHHMAQGLRLIDHARAESLRKVKLPTIREQLLGHTCSSPLVVVDAHWTHTVDTQVDACIRLPPNSVSDGHHLRVLQATQNFTLVQAVTPGINPVSSTSGEWRAVVRVSHKDYVGLAHYRFEETTGDE